MPIIQIKYATPKPVAGAKVRLARMARDTTVRLLGKKPELISILVEEVAPQDWIVAGVPVSESTRATIWLEIRVTDETNTKVEKADFIQATFEAAGDILGPLNDESYIHVLDVRADAYGYGGQTQEQRFIAARLAELSRKDMVADAYRRYGVR